MNLQSSTKKYLGECHTEVAIVLGKGWANRFEIKVWYSPTENILSIKQAVGRGGGMVLKDTQYPLYEFQTDTITFSESKIHCIKNSPALEILSNFMEPLRLPIHIKWGWDSKTASTQYPEYSVS